MSRSTAWIVLIASLIGVYLIHFWMERFAAEEICEQRARLILTAMEADRYITSSVIKPALWKEFGDDRFVIEAMSSSFGARNVFNRIRESYPAFSFKHACLDPRNRRNLATDQEKEIIAQFARDPELTLWDGVMKHTGERRSYIATPVRITDQCLKCHGEPEEAPENIQEIYGTEYGYSKKPGELIGALIVSVPLELANNFGIETYGFLGALLCLVLAPFIIALRSRETPSDEASHE
ncbi:MAG: DUF3365 domain-containing protein [Candidatus Coatesbacteria bacterium]|nr:DUF3365 domain-containing protein [Candidatus Coatesbacteria bacterium]